MNNPRSLCRTCGHVRALHLRRTPRDVTSPVFCSVQACTCARFVDAQTEGDPVCLACKTSEDVETVTLISSTRELHAEIYLCRSHVNVYGYHVARVLGDLLKGKLSIP